MVRDVEHVSHVGSFKNVHDAPSRKVGDLALGVDVSGGDGALLSSRQDA
jgi:hypothetical protein